MEERLNLISEFEKSPSTKACELLSSYKKLEGTKEFNSAAATNLILLLSMLEKWDEAKRLKDQYLYLFDKQTKVYESLVGVINKFKGEPFCNIYDNLIFFRASNSIETSRIINEY